MRASRIVVSGTAVLAACGALGLCPGAVQASQAQAPTWTQQHPATSPPRSYNRPAMAYDAATGNVVLVDSPPHSYYAQTWTWDGTTWTQQHPATSPPHCLAASMAYDAATGTVVLFTSGGHNTWTWDGTTWTQQHPMTSPQPRYFAAMAYDAATGTVVMFGGRHTEPIMSDDRILNDTWTWDGTTWTRQHPTTSPAARFGAVMAYDAATGTVVLSTGTARQTGPPPLNLGDTWTWDGTTWTQQHPATGLERRGYAAMTYDTATGGTVLFGGFGSHQQDRHDTWTWDGTTWTHQGPAVSPVARQNAAMAYDAASGTVVLFGGFHYSATRGSYRLDDTWTWG